MKIKAFANSILLAVLAFAFTGCYTYTVEVGEGAQGSRETTAWNHYVVYGLAPVDVSDPKELAAGATDYTVTTEIDFVTGLIGGLTWGIYTPTITTVTK